MGAFFAALGAVLLFLLKLVGILLLVVLVLALLLLLIPFCADIAWEKDVLTVKAGALGLNFPVFRYPKPEPPETAGEPKGFWAKWKARRAERKRKKAAQKPKQPPKEKKPEKGPDIDLIYRQVEDKLKSIMGTKVVINQKDKNKGRIEIEYYSQEELERLIELMESLKS